MRRAVRGPTDGVKALLACRVCSNAVRDVMDYTQLQLISNGLL